MAWTQGLETVTVFAPYASVGMGTLQQAHTAGRARDRGFSGTASGDKINYPE